MLNMSYTVTLLCVIYVACLTWPVEAHQKTSLPPPKRYDPAEEDPQFWRRVAAEERAQAFKRAFNVGLAKNVILFVGDGMGLSTQVISRIYKGQLAGRTGEEEKLEWEKFPNVGLSKTYSVDHQVTDSAATATAYLCGVKTHYGVVAADGRTTRGDCGSLHGREVDSIAKLAQEQGKATGVVTTARITHASPTPLYAHTVDRNWESFDDLPQSARDQGCRDMAQQLLDNVGINMQVVMGGGRRAFLPNTTADPEYGDQRGRRSDGRDLVKEWSQAQVQKGRRARFVYDQAGFDSLRVEETDYVLGLFEPSHMKYEKERQGEPSVANMTRKAIELLRKDDDGYFLFVEGARIDHAHHDNFARRAMEETLALEEAVAAAVAMTDSRDTLIVVTADHATPISMTGYPYRGNDILGLVDYSDLENAVSDFDGLPYTTLAYGVGPGFNGSRPNITNVDTRDRDYRPATAVPVDYVSHDGVDVPVYASGPMAHMVHGVHEQVFVFDVMRYAACLGPDANEECRTRSEFMANFRLSNSVNGASGVTSCLSFILFVIAFAFTSCL